MSTPPVEPKIYHITPVMNLPQIIASGGLWSEAKMVQRGGPPTTIGMAKIKSRRLTLPVTCNAGDFVGDYVPFYYCPRSVMLYLVHRDNHPELDYHGGQDPVVHLEADLYEVLDWANGEGCRWAISLSNAGATYAQFKANVSNLAEIEWEAVAATDWAGELMEGKQAEFLVRDFFPWDLVRRIGVRTLTTQEHTLAALEASTHKPPVEMRAGWYY